MHVVKLRAHGSTGAATELSFFDNFVFLGGASDTNVVAVGDKGAETGGGIGAWTADAGAGAVEGADAWAAVPGAGAIEGVEA